MQSLLNQRLEDALYFENRGCLESAKPHYQFLAGNLQFLDKDALVKVSKFYFSQTQFDIAFEAGKLAIEKNGNLQELVPIFIQSWEAASKDEKELEWLLLQPGIEFIYDQKTIVAKYLFESGKKSEAYLLSLETANAVEREFQLNPSTYSLYITTMLWLVELEYMLENYTQARFHLRKLMYLKKERLEKTEAITYWAIRLDEVAHLVAREDWLELEKQLSQDLLLFVQFYQQLSERKMTKRFADALQAYDFTDTILQQKQRVCLRFLRKLKGDADWYRGIEEEWDGNQNDVLLTLLYAEYLKKFDAPKGKMLLEQEFLKHADMPTFIRAYSSLFEYPDEKDLSDCEVMFFGGGEKIGGTSILVSVKGHHILLDAGMHLHEETYHPDYTPLLEKGLSLKDLDALLITHAHLDHTGAVPFIHKERPQLPIYATEATTKLMKLLLEDSLKLADFEAQKDMYSELDLQNTIMNTKSVQFNQSFTVPSKDDYWKVTYFPAGHILGAAAIHLEMKGVSILFTGDYSIDEQQTVEGLQLPEDLKIDVLITESTYGYVPTNASMNRPLQEELFVKSIERTMDKKGSMLIPAFAVGRAQEIVLILREKYKKTNFLPFDVFLDGRVIDVCRIYQRFAEQGQFIHPKYHGVNNGQSLFFDSGIQSAKDLYSDSRYSLNSFESFFGNFISKGKNCIVSSSGMLTEGSASARYAEYLLEDERNAISFTGYLDEESPGRHILQTAKGPGETIRCNGKEKVLRARVESFRLSAHASREQMVKLIAQLQPKQVFLMHGEHQQRYKPIQTVVNGEVIYPSIYELLSHLPQIKVTPAFNGTEYQMDC